MIVKVHDCVGVQNEGQNSNTKRAVLIMLPKGNNILPPSQTNVYMCVYRYRK